MTGINTIKRLRELIEKTTPHEINENLFRAHYLLARLYERYGDLEESAYHFEQAVDELLRLCFHSTKSQYRIGRYGTEKLDIPEYVQRRLGEYREKMFDFAEHHDFDASPLSMAPTTSEERRQIERVLEYTS